MGGIGRDGPGPSQRPGRLNCWAPRVVDGLCPRFIAPLATLGAVVANPSPAAADTGGYPWASATCQDSPLTYNGVQYCPNDNWVYNGVLYDSWRYSYRNCTSWVAWRLSTNNGYTMPHAIGDASAWGGYSPHMASQSTTFRLLVRSHGNQVVTTSLTSSQSHRAAVKSPFPSTTRPITPASPQPETVSTIPARSLPARSSTST